MYNLNLTNNLNSSKIKSSIILLIGMLLLTIFFLRNLAYINYDFSSDYEVINYYNATNITNFNIGNNLIYILIFFQFFLLINLFNTLDKKNYIIFTVLFLSFVFSIKNYSFLKDFLSSFLIPIFSLCILFLLKNIMINKKHLKFFFTFFFIFTNLLTFKLHIEINSYINHNFLLPFFYHFDLGANIYNFFNYNVSTFGTGNSKNCIIFFSYSLNLFFLKQNNLKFNNFFLLINLIFLFSYLIHANTYIVFVTFLISFLTFYKFHFINKKKFLIFFLLALSFSPFLLNPVSLTFTKYLVNLSHASNTDIKISPCSDPSATLSDFEIHAYGCYTIIDPYYDKFDASKYSSFLPHTINSHYNLKFAQIGLIKRMAFQDEIFSLISINKNSFFFVGLSKKDIDFLNHRGFFTHNSFLNIMIKYGLIFYFLFLFFIFKFFSSSSNYFILLFFISFSITQIFDDYLFGNRSDLTFIFWFLLSILSICFDDKKKQLY